MSTITITVTADRAAAAAARTAAIVARMHADADAAEQAGNVEGANALRRIAESRARAGARVVTGARAVAA